jgi:hypothetical protein
VEESLELGSLGAKFQPGKSPQSGSHVVKTNQIMAWRQ